MKVTHKELGKTIEVERVIGRYDQEEEGPCLIITAAIHGNEPSGVFAARKVLDKLEKHDIPIKGGFIAITGHLAALEKGQRQIKEDLNRIWLEKRVAHAKKNSDLTPEEKEMKEVLEVIEEITSLPHLANTYFVDCHTTSAESVPYISVHDVEHSMMFTKNFPLYVVRGFNNMVPGSIDDYLSNLGFTGFTYEAGQHDTLTSIDNQEAMIWMALVHCGCIQRHDIPWYESCRDRLAKSIFNHKEYFKITYRQAIDNGTKFKMKDGYINFEQIYKGELLATYEEDEIRSQWDGKILLPLYQKTGNDGFFVVEPVLEPIAERI